MPKTIDPTLDAAFALCVWPCLLSFTKRGGRRSFHCWVGWRWQPSVLSYLQREPQDRAIVAAIIRMAKSLNLSTTAEGVEDDATRQILLDLGWAHGRSYFFAWPFAGAAFDQAVGGFAPQNTRTT